MKKKSNGHKRANPFVDHNNVWIKRYYTRTFPLDLDFQNAMPFSFLFNLALTHLSSAFSHHFKFIIIEFSFKAHCMSKCSMQLQFSNKYLCILFLFIELHQSIWKCFMMMWLTAITTYHCASCGDSLQLLFPKSWKRLMLRSSFWS